MDRPDLLHFTPVPLLRRRAQGWTPDRQLAFIATLATCGVVAEAARSVGCTPRSAYLLRARPEAESFAAAWDHALDQGLDAARDRAMANILGVRDRPLVRRGCIVGTVRAENHRLIYAALRALATDVHGQRSNLPHRRRIAAREQQALPSVTIDPE
ncbi:MAG: hypothetical protein PSY12_13835 [bacterium]|nr:hypothetical protein [bacterium]